MTPEVQEMKLQQLFDTTLAALIELAEEHCNAVDSMDEERIEDAQRAIHEDPLSIRVRDGWRNLGDSRDNAETEEFEILLGTGGPATRIVGQLDGDGHVENFHVEVQDWGTPWTSFARMTGVQGDMLKRWYLSEFYFGEY